MPEVLRFERPSDVLAAFRRWRPNAPFKVLPYSDSGRNGHRMRSLGFLCSPDYPSFGGDCTGERVRPAPYFDDEALAFVALAKCLPGQAWVIHEASPLLWVLERHESWDGGETNFGDCVRKLSADVDYPWSNSPDTEQGRRAAERLVQKIGDYLMTHRCTGHGPDDCLVLLDTLIKLAPASPRLPEIFERIAPDFSSQDVSGIPSDLAVKRGAHQGKDWEAAQLIRRREMAQVIYLTLRLDMLSARPTDIVLPGEPAATLARLFSLAEDLLLLDRIQGTLWPEPRIENQRSFANPWGLLFKTAGFPIWDTALADQARQAVARGKVPDCLSPIDGLNGLPEAYWRGYWLAGLEAGPQACKPQGETGWVKAYRAATTADAPSLVAFAPLRAYLGDERRADAHLALVMPLAEHCPLAGDPWRICAWAGDTAHRRRSEQGEHRLSIPRGQRFKAEPVFTHMGVLEHLPGDVRLAAVLARLERREGRALPEVRAILEQMAAQWPGWVDDFVPTSVRRWWRSTSALRALEIDIPADREEQSSHGSGLLVYGQGVTPRLVRLPGGFGQYDDGQLAALTDLDGDGRLEAWFSGEWGECDGEGSVAGVDCAITEYRLGGEVFGDRLGPYIAGPLPER